MKVFCDTSVLVAGSVRRHPHFARARPLLESVAGGENEGVISSHSLAEAYSALTSLPLRPRISPADADLMIATNMRAHFQVLAVSSSMYERAIKICVQHSLVGGKVYDALLLECARKASCKRIYTFNVEDFLRLAPDLREKVAAP